MDLVDLSNYHKQLWYVNSDNILRLAPCPHLQSSSAVGPTQTWWQKLREWKWMILLVFFVGAILVLHLLGDTIDVAVGTQRFVSNLGGISSEDYCPDYAKIVKVVLEPYAAEGRRIRTEEKDKVI